MLEITLLHDPRGARGNLRLAVLCAALAVTFACASSPKPAPSNTSSLHAEDPARTAPLLEGMGDLHWPISTESELAQRYFDQALTLAYGFNHLEAERSFREAARLDEDCAMCWWGVALVLGPNINDPLPTPEREEQAYQALTEALARLEHANEMERALIAALESRYAPTPPTDRAPLDQAYAEAMRTVADRFPDDLEVQTLFAEALMDTMPWAYWAEDGEPKPLTKEVFATLERVIERDSDHPGANHFYIHVSEQEQPKRAEKSADNLRRVVPGAGHLVHMPSHIYIRVGRYHDGSSANELAIVADDDYVTQCRAQGIYPLAYVPHNHHFLWATTTMEGRSADAIAAARHTAEHVDGDMMRVPELAMLQHFSAIPYYGLVRFGKWEEILLEPAPEADLVYPTAVWHYARGIAYVRTKRLDEAKQELRSLRKLAADPSLEELRIFGLNPLSALAEIATAVLHAEIAAALGNTDAAVAQLRKAVAIEDSLVYGEPPDWFYPVRHNLGAVLLEAGRARAAEKVYREDLARFPDNGWALFGLAQSLRAQGKVEEAEQVDRRFEAAWKYADVEITSSRF